MEKNDVAVMVMLVGIMSSLWFDSLWPMVLYVGAMVWIGWEDILAAWRRLWL